MLRRFVAEQTDIFVPDDHTKSIKDDIRIRKIKKNKEALNLN